MTIQRFPWDCAADCTLHCYALNIPPFIHTLIQSSGSYWCFKKFHPKVRNHGEGPYKGLLLVESGYYRFHI